MNTDGVGYRGRGVGKLDAGDGNGSVGGGRVDDDRGRSGEGWNAAIAGHAVEGQLARRRRRTSFDSGEATCELAHLALEAIDRRGQAVEGSCRHDRCRQDLSSGGGWRGGGRWGSGGGGGVGGTVEDVGGADMADDDVPAVGKAADTRLLELARLLIPDC